MQRCGLPASRRTAADEKDFRSSDAYDSQRGHHRPEHDPSSRPTDTFASARSRSRKKPSLPLPLCSGHQNVRPAPKRQPDACAHDAWYDRVHFVTLHPIVAPRWPQVWHFSCWPRLDALIRSWYAPCASTYTSGDKSAQCSCARSNDPSGRPFVGGAKKTASINGPRASSASEAAELQKQQAGSIRFAASMAAGSFRAAADPATPIAASAHRSASPGPGTCEDVREVACVLCSRLFNARPRATPAF